jgi:hypothetical protein
MLTEFIYQWNPFNICGSEVGVDDLICNPLQPNETLRLDRYGHFRRINVSIHHPTLWERVVFWFQTHLNEKDHLQAINKLISLFYQRLLQSPPQQTEKMQEFNLHINQLRSLKNDYGFVYIKEENSSFIDLRLKEIERHAYSIFAYYHKRQIIEQEEVKKEAFILFQHQIKQKLQDLSLEYLVGLQAARLLIMAPITLLHALFEERVRSLNNRLQTIEDLHVQLNELEKEHEGKFTIPFISDYLDQVRTKLRYELCKISLEVEILIENLILNYRLAPFKEEVKWLLDSLQVDPDEFHKKHSYAFLLQEALDSEIQRLRLFLKGA